MYNQLLLLTFFLAAPYLLVWLKDLVWDLYLWQTKEYRLDRVRSQWVYEKDKGMRSELSIMLKIALLTFMVAFSLVPDQSILGLSFVIAYFIYWNEALEFLQKLFKGRLLRPQIKSPRNLLIAFLALLLMSAPFIIIVIWLSSLSYLSSMGGSNLPLLAKEATFNDVVAAIVPKDVEGVVVMKPEYVIVSLISGFGILMDLLAPAFTALGVLLTWPLSALRRRWLIARGAAKLRGLTKVKVVAVTGSYGKSTTKELLYQLLSKRFKTVKTEKNNNTDIGIALTVLNKVSSATEVFIAEMGAYKLGETRDCCRVAPPDVAIITGVDQQHVSLFGGIREVLASTYEVIEELKPDGLAILNGDNEYCLKIAEKSTRRKILYFSIHNTSKMEASELTFKEEKPPIKHKISFPGNENVFVKEIDMTKKGLSFNMNFAGRSYEVRTNLKAVFNISNLLAAILTATDLGMSMSEVVKLINEMEFEVPYLNVREGLNQSKVVDDGYNSNPTGFISALKFMENMETKSKRWVMTQGLIELGPEREATNRRIAKEITARADALYTTDMALFEQVRKADPKFEAVLVRSVFDFPAYYRALIKKNHVVLLEGSFPQEVLKQIYTRYYK